MVMVDSKRFCEAPSRLRCESTDLMAASMSASGVVPDAAPDAPPVTAPFQHVKTNGFSRARGTVNGIA